MQIDKNLLDRISEEARQSPRLRKSFDLRNSAEDNSQRMLNALEPGTEIPIHRHTTTTEAIAVLRGRCVQYLFDGDGRRTGAVFMAAGSDCPGMVVEAGQWHRLESLEPGTVILECKDGKYEPLSEKDVLHC